MNLKPFNATGTVEGWCLVKTCEKKMTAKGVPYLDLVLTDSSGEIGAKMWDYKQEQHSFIEPNILVKVRGTVSVFNEADQLRIERIRPRGENDDVRIEDYVPCADYSGEQMFAEIEKVVDAFQSQELKKLVTAVLAQYKPQLLYWPAAFKLHHAVRSGLLLHTLSVLRLAQSVCNIYPFVDRDLLCSGAILHDVAKTQELSVSDTGVSSGYNTDGELVGHLVRGAMIVERIGTEEGISRETLTLVEHMLISHHGEPEFGAAKMPMFLEADILAQLDMLDARVYEISAAAAAADKGSFTPKQWMLDNRKLYNHGRVDKPLVADLLNE